MITFKHGTQQTSFLFGQVKLFEGPGECKKFISTSFSLQFTFCTSLAHQLLP